MLATGLLTGVIGIAAGDAGAAPAGVRQWKIQPAPAAGALWGVTCTSARACVSVGTVPNSKGTAVVLGETWNGTAWTIAPAQSPKGALQSYLDSVACTSADACVAVGDTEDSDGGHQALAETWNGTAWGIIPLPSVAQSFLNGVACASATDCTAVGGYVSNPADAPLAFGWNGKQWKIEPTPVPSGSVSAAFGDVACTSADSCVAVGSYETKASIVFTLVEVWNGTTWAVQPTPNEPGYDKTALHGSLLLGVSCSSSKACSAVGSYGSSGSSPVSYTLAESWNGKRWRIDPSSDPGKSSDGYGPINALSAVACSSATSCTAVGSYDNGSRTLVTLAESWNGTRWTTEVTPNPAGATNSQLDDVTCISRRACVAVGSYLDGAPGTGGSLVERSAG